MKLRLLLGLLIGIPMFAIAQWVDDPDVNTMVLGTEYAHTFPKIATTSDGNFYISSWRSVPDTNVYYEVWLQYLNHDGYVQWGTDGVLISDNPSRSWISDYSLVTNPNGNAILAFEDMRGGSGFSHVSVYSVAPDGHAVWDTNGIQLTTDPLMAFSPTICLTNSNNVLVAWNADISAKDTNAGIFIKVQKLSPAGVPLWTEPLTVAGPDSNYIFPNLMPVGTDDFIMVWQKKFEIGMGTGYEMFSYIYAMRFGADGSMVWPDVARICDHGDSAYVVPEFLKLRPVQDNNQGVYVTWFDGRSKNNFSNVYVQHIDTSGKLQWPMNGIAVSPENYGYDRVDPMVGLDPGNQDLFVFWEEYRAVGAFDSFGILGQKIKPDGSVAWGDLGKQMSVFIMDTMWYIEGVAPCPNNKFVLLMDQEYDSIVGPDTLLFDQLFATQIDTSGLQTWTKPTVLMAATRGTKFYPDLSDLSENIFVVTWAENRDDAFNPNGVILAQNISLNGQLGPLGIPVYPADESGILLYPNPTGSNSWLEFTEAVSGTVEVEVFNSFGQPIEHLTRSLDRANYSIPLSANRIPSGIYLLRVRFNEKEKVVRWVVLK